MKIETKYNVGDYVEYERTQRTVGGKETKHRAIGIIESVSVRSGNKIAYYLTDGYYRGAIAESEILSVLGPVA